MSSRYEGLSLPELLDLMHEIVIPEPVRWSPQTAGWWVVLFWLIVVILLIVISVRRRRRRNRYRRDALRALQAVGSSGDLAPQESARAVAEILKRAALAAYPREEVASLHGEAWARFLSESSGNDRQVQGAAEQLAAAAYRPDADGGRILEPAKRWVRLHRA